MRILTWLAFIFLTGTTAALAGAFAWHTGQTHGEGWAWIAAAAVCALVAAECIAAADRHTSLWLRVPALVVVMAAIASLELGFAAAIFSDARAAREQGASSARKMADREPAAAVRARLQGLEGQHPGIKAAWCGSPVTARREACAGWIELRAELADAEAIERRGTRATGDADARAALVTRLAGGTQQWWADAFIVLLSIAFSLGRALLAAALSRWPRDTAIALPVTVAEVQPSPAPVVAETVVPVPAPVQTEPAPPGNVVPFQPAPVLPALPDHASRVLGVVASLAEPVDPSQGFVGFLPPGQLSQRALAERAALSRRHVADSLEALEAAGLLKVEAHGRDGTAYKVLRAPG